MEVTKESWDALVAGQVRDVARINDLQTRLCQMARQVEKLSFMVEYLADDLNNESPYWCLDDIIADAADQWGLVEQPRRAT